MSLRQRLAQRLRQREEADFRRQEALAKAGADGYNKARVAHHEMGPSALLWFQRKGCLCHCPMPPPSATAQPIPSFFVDFLHRFHQMVSEYSAELSRWSGGMRFCPQQQTLYGRKFAAAPPPATKVRRPLRTEKGKGSSPRGRIGHSGPRKVRIFLLNKKDEQKVTSLEKEKELHGVQAQMLRQREEADFRRQEALAKAGTDGYNKARVAHHEMGHSALLWFQRKAGVFESTTVVPIGDDEGLTTSIWHTQMTRAEMKALLCVQMAGGVSKSFRCS
ncbi:hypothetical protein GPALN_005132 [Globodera pallida]|nr:hypothetical protein GPALN_005132 [Globodera pallida]